MFAQRCFAAKSFATSVRRCASIGRSEPFQRLSTPSMKWFSTNTTETENRIGKEQNERSEGIDVRVLRRLGWLPTQLEVQSNANVNRYKFVPAAILNHVCLGGVFAWSMFNEPITRLSGVIVPAAGDWLLASTAVTFSLIMGGFVWGAFTGKYLMRWGPRASCLLGACTLGGGFAIASVALSTANLPLLYLGGAVWGMSLSLSYVPPVATLLQWFPDRKGFASGGCILGFGLGSALAVPVFGSLLRHFRRAPERLGAVDEVPLVTENGRLFAGGREVIVATLADVRSWGIEEGVYAVGTGTTGLPQTFAVLSVTYFVLMAMSAFVYRLPAKGVYTPPPAAVHAVAAGATPTGAVHASATAPPLVPKVHNVNADVAIRTPQFWIAYASFGLSICGAYACLATGKTMMADSFGVLMPDVVTASFMATFVAMMGAANLGGRVVWPALSDVLARRISPAEPFWGRRLTFSLMWGMGPPLYILIVWSVHACAAGNTTILPLITYVMGVCGVLAAFGGTAATRPALAADLFGNKHVGIITAQQLSVVMPAAFAGPWIASYFREKSLRSSATELAALVEPSRFKQAFGTSIDQLPALLDAKTVTIVRLMEIVPPGTVDPTPFVYDTTLYVVAAMQATAFCTNQFLKPVPSSKYALEEGAVVIENNEAQKQK